MHYCATWKQIQDIFTKPFNPNNFVYFIDKIGVISSMAIKGG